MFISTSLLVNVLFAIPGRGKCLAGVRAAVARSASGEALVRLARTWDPALASFIVLNNPNVRKKHLRMLAAIDHGAVKAALVSHPECPKAVMFDVAKYGGEAARAALAERNELPEFIQECLCADRSSLVRQCVAGNPAVREELRVIASLI